MNRCQITRPIFRMILDDRCYVASCMENPPRYFPLISLSGTIHRDHVFVDTPIISMGQARAWSVETC